MRIPIFIFFIAAALLISVEACAPAEGDFPGHEYFQDMGHSTAYEANYMDYYKWNTWGSVEDYKHYAQPRLPVPGTVPRGDAGIAGGRDPYLMDSLMQGMTPNGYVPYHYDNTEEDLQRAINEITENPYPITVGGLTAGNTLYGIFCATCHGGSGEGDGYLVREDGGIYPAAPTNFMTEEFINASNGRYYHAIMYGKGMMGPYADKLSYSERWQVIHYIRQLQALSQGLQYDENENTFGAGAKTQKELLAETIEAQMNNEQIVPENQSLEGHELNQQEH